MQKYVFIFLILYRIDGFAVCPPDCPNPPNQQPSAADYQALTDSILALELQLSTIQAEMVVQNTTILALNATLIDINENVFVIHWLLVATGFFGAAGIWIVGFAVAWIGRILGFSTLGTRRVS